MKKSRIILSAISLAVILSASACASKSDVSADANVAATEADGADHAGENDTSVISGVVGAETTIDHSKLFSNRDLSGDYDAAKCDSIMLSDAGCTTDSKNVTIDRSTVTITGHAPFFQSSSPCT